MAATKPAPATRPSDRRALILAAAARLFHTRGYDRVSLDDIASAVSISAPGLYRHFPGKQALLVAVVDDNLEALQQEIGSAVSVDELAAGLARFAAEHEHVGVLLIREVDRLDAEARSSALSRYNSAVHGIARLIAAARPEVPEGTRLILARAALAATTSSSYNPSAAGTPAQRDVILRAIQFICSTLDVGESDLVPVTPRTHSVQVQRPWLTRRAAIMAAAPWLLVANGSHESTTLEEIGAAVGLTGSAIYTYFPSKSDLFHAVATRALSWAASDLERALAMSVSGSDALRRGLMSLIEIAPRFSPELFNPDLLNLTIEQRSAMTRQADSYLAMWLECVRAARPDFTLMEQGVALVVTFGIISEFVDRDRGAARHPSDGALAQLALSVVLGV